MIIKRNITITIICITVLFTACSTPQEKKKDIPSLRNTLFANQIQPQLFSILRDDNDISLEDHKSGVPEELPEVAAAHITKDIVTYYCFNIHPDRVDSVEEIMAAFPITNALQVIYKVILDNNMVLYITQLYFPTYGLTYKYHLYNPSSQKVLPAIKSTGSRWMLTEKDKPFIYQTDINNDGKQELVIKQGVRNGTMYESILEHYYSIHSDRAEKLFTLESNSSILGLKFDEGDYDTLKRKIVFVQKNTYKIVVRLSSTKLKTQYGLIGYYTIKKQSNGTFQIVDRKAKDEGFDRMLVTFSELDELERINQ